MPSPQISVVVPAYRDGAALRAQLPKLVALAGADEVIVAAADDVTAADGLDAARACGATVVHAPVGRGTQMNAGARAARGAHLLFLHADSWLDPDALREGGARLAEPGVGAVVFRQCIEGTRRVYRFIEGAASFRARVLRTPYGDSGLLLRRADFERVGGFPEIPLCEDLGFARRLRPLGRIVVAESRIHLSARRWEEHGVIRTALLNWWIAASFLAGAAPARLYRVYYGRPLPTPRAGSKPSAS